VKWNVPAPWKVVEAEREAAVPARTERTLRAVFAARGSGLHVVTADVAFGGRELHEWTEALVRVRP
jgi:hypothetical protein